MTQTATPHLWAISHATGALLWQRVLPVDHTEASCMAFAAGGILLYQHATLGQPQETQWPLLALDASTGATKWQAATAFPYSQVAASAGLVLATSGALEGTTCAIDVWAFDPNTGSRVWRATLPLALNQCNGFALPHGYWITAG